MILILMGVSGCGKSTVGRLLASRLQWEFVEADDYHSPKNREKMQNGIPLNDQDRQPWLEALAQVISQHVEAKTPMILACSALRESYRAMLGVNQDAVRTVYLKGSRELLASRLAQRKHPFFNPALLDSQLSTLEDPPDGLTLSIDLTPREIVDRIAQWIEVVP